MTNPKAFKTGREFAAWIGLVPRQNSTGGKERLGSISKQGDRYLRRLFVVGAISIVRTARMQPDKYPWVIELLGRRPAKVVAVINGGSSRSGRRLHYPIDFLGSLRCRRSRSFNFDLLPLDAPVFG
jgi:hypothetical protein